MLTQAKAVETQAAVCAGTWANLAVNAVSWPQKFAPAGPR